MLAGALTKAVQSTGSIASTGLGLRYIGKHAYAYGGEFSLSTLEQTVLDFTTGSAGYIWGYLFVSGGVKPGSSVGGITTFQIKINGINTIWLKTETAQEDSPLNTKVKLILPPKTTLSVITDSDATATDIFTTVTFTGRVYGAE